MKSRLLSKSSATPQTALASSATSSASPLAALTLLGAIAFFLFCTGLLPGDASAGRHARGAREGKEKARREEVSKLTGLYAPTETVRHSRRGQHTLPRPADLTRVAPQPAEVSPGQ